MTPEREHDLERWDEAENRADKLTEERDCLREKLREAEAENRRLSALLHEIAEMASAMQVTVRAIQEAWVPASKTEPPRP